MADESRFESAGFEGLMDFSFQRFITLNVIKVLYILGLVLIALGWIGAVVSGFAGGAGQGLFMFVFATIAAALYVIFLRVWLELIVVIFRIGENTSRIAGAGQSDVPPPPTPPGTE